MKKIAFYCDCNSKGGVWIYTLKMAKMFSVNGCEVYILSHAPGSDSEQEFFDELRLSAADIKVFSREGELEQTIIAKKMAAYILATEIEVYFPNYRDVSFLALHFLQDICTVATCHNNHESYYKKIIRYDSLLDLVIFPNRAAMIHCEREFSSHRARYKYIPHYIDMDATETDTPDLEQLNLVYFGRMEREQKQIFEIITIGLSLKSRGCDFEITVIGNGSDREEFIVAVNKANLSEHIKIYEAMTWDDLVPFIRRAHFSLLTSTYEGFCYSAAESMALSVPLACYKNTAIDDYVKNGINGIVVSWGDVDALVEKVLRTLGSKTYADMRQQAATYVQKNFSINRVYAEYRFAINSEMASLTKKSWPLFRPIMEPSGRDFFGRAVEFSGKKIGMWK